MKRTDKYAAMTKDEAQHSRMTFYFAVRVSPSPSSIPKERLIAES